jgi:hypothetical protein
MIPANQTSEGKAKNLKPETHQLEHEKEQKWNPSGSPAASISHRYLIAPTKKA